MHSASLHWQRSGPRLNSPLAFLDHPFCTPYSTFLFFTTIVLASALIYCITRQHYNRVRRYSSSCQCCDQIRKGVRDAGTYARGARTEGSSENFGYDNLESGKSSCSWSDGAKSGSEIFPGDSFGSREESGHYLEQRQTRSCVFHTPLTGGLLFKALGYQEGQSDPQILLEKNMTARVPHWLDPELQRVRKDESERAKWSNWPVRLQKVVVGDVKESGIAKRRLTVGRADGI